MPGTLLSTPEPSAACLISDCEKLFDESVYEHGHAVNEAVKEAVLFDVGAVAYLQRDSLSRDLFERKLQSLQSPKLLAQSRNAVTAYGEDEERGF